MKKRYKALLATGVFFVTFWFGMMFGGLVFGAEPKIGDPMPDPSKIEGLEKQDTQKPWRWLDGTLGGYLYVWRSPNGVDDDDIVIWVVAYQVCNGEQMPRPIGVFHWNIETLYIDSYPRDGIIDKIAVKDYHKRVHEDTIKCDRMVSIEEFAIRFVTEVRGN